ncbi:hypothetical protein ABT56_18815 [Photobacterium aquae]|uniref:Conjugal transfer protein TraN n=1 Tax=Photobacterium aquae TaxID=1195763 RepID=A0A0J1GVL9_9GAMM|nr:conjugal transfer protein TraN [Photobacterium aquae]KLV03489.1 hypothetical protein ABT56_18815 [Photobacterium aquae]
MKIFTQRLISYLLIITTQSMYSTYAFSFQASVSEDESEVFDHYVNEASKYAKELRSKVSIPIVDNEGNISVNGEQLMTVDEITGVKDSDSMPVDIDGTYGNDAAIIKAGEDANRYYQHGIDGDGNKINNPSYDAYNFLHDSFGKQKPNLDNDPIWDVTDNVFNNLEEISESFSKCKISTEFLPNGDKPIHVPKLEYCERVLAIEDSFTVSHDYDVGVLRHHSGPVNMLSCGEGCVKAWIGTVGDDYFGGRCKIYEEEMSIEVLRPDAISKVTLEYSKFDDYHQVWINDSRVYNGPNENFPPETDGPCELGTSWQKRPNIDLTRFFRDSKPNSQIPIKTRTSVTGGGEGYSRLQINFDPKSIVANDVWLPKSDMDKALDIIQQSDDGICKASIQCLDMPALDVNGCTTINGHQVCESNFKPSPFPNISPMCRKMSVTSSCKSPDTEICWENLSGETVCYDNDNVAEQNTCQPYESNVFPNKPDKKCSFVKSECMDGGMSNSGTCYIYEDTYDCGFTVGDTGGDNVEIIDCDGELRCVGEDCITAEKDGANKDFGQVVGYLEMLKYAKADMQCENVPESPYQPESPPDEYYPIPVCKDGFLYDVLTDKCLQKKSCEFDNSNFYSVDLRSGIEVKARGNVIADSDDVRECSPIENGDVIYTCGTEKKRESTKIDHEICTNIYDHKTEIGCPDKGHAVHPANGLCNVLPVYQCESGSALVDKGGNKFDDSNYTCEKITEKPANGFCPNGTQLVGDSCIGFVEPLKVCKEGVINNDGVCEVSKNQCKFDRDSSYFSTTTDSVFTNGDVWKINNKCLEVAGESPEHEIYMGYFCGNNGVDLRPQYGVVGKGKLRRHKKTDRCNNIIFDKYYENGKESNVFSGLKSEVIPKICLGGEDTKFYEICTKELSYIPAISECPDGSVLEGDKCKIISEPNFGCDNGTYNPENQTCEEKAYSDPIKKCPATYPKWDKVTNTCKKADLSLDEYFPKPSNFLSLPKRMRMFDQSWAKDGLDDNASNKEKEDLTAKEKIYAHALLKIDGLNSLSGELSENEKMEFNNIKRHMVNDFLVNSNPNVYKHSVSDKSGGTGDVNCQIFGAEAAYCKKAMGGVQDCCTSPSSISLGDYIKMTNTMIQLDGMTAELELIGDYTGVWKPAQEYAGEVMDNVLSTINETLFSSSKDVAVGTATDTISMEVFKEKAMQATFDFMTDMFGEQVAGLFFNNAGGSLELSSGMQSAATVMMYVYYAYLVYVIVNLLIDIIWECSEDEFSLAMKRDLLSTHSIGSYCANEALGLCIEKREVHCVFNSPVSRIMMEQIYRQPQMQARGYSWGTPENPVCRGIWTEDLQYVDFDKINMDEWVAILKETDNFPDKSNINTESLTGIDNFLNVNKDDPRLNIEERTREKMTKEDGSMMDGDKLLRDSYEHKWQSLQ